LNVTDAAGKSVTQAKAAKIGADPALDFTPSVDGTFRVEVSDLTGQGSNRHVYLLRIAPIVPDFELKVASDLFTLTQAKTLEIPVAITRVGGFTQDVTLSVDGLPKGIEVKATAKSITLRLTEKAAFAGPIRIVGTAKDGTTRPARATIAEFGRVTESLWLTAVSK
jgi:hypothetical protein